MPSSTSGRAKSSASRSVSKSRSKPKSVPKASGRASGSKPASKTNGSNGSRSKPTASKPGSPSTSARKTQSAPVVSRSRVATRASATSAPTSARKSAPGQVAVQPPPLLIKPSRPAFLYGGGWEDKMVEDIASRHGAREIDPNRRQLLMLPSSSSMETPPSARKSVRFADYDSENELTKTESGAPDPETGMLRRKPRDSGASGGAKRSRSRSAPKTSPKAKTKSNAKAKAKSPKRKTGAKPVARTRK